MSDKAPRRSTYYTPAEELANVITHGVGTLMAFGALVTLVAYAAIGADPYRIISVSIFGATLILCYLSSTLYHGIPHPKAKDVLRVCDHCAIYLLIAGTYTPFLMVSMGNSWIAWALLIFMWAFALAGCTFKVFFTGRGELLSTAVYLGMGWSFIVAIKPTIEYVPGGALVLLALGGLSYTVGTAFYLWHRLPYNHAIWHLFVLGGSAFHFAAILAYVVPVPTAG
jgi:hemolysin III